MHFIAVVISFKLILILEIFMNLTSKSRIINIAVAAEAVNMFIITKEIISLEIEPVRFIAVVIVAAIVAVVVATFKYSTIKSYLILLAAM